VRDALQVGLGCASPRICQPPLTCLRACWDPSLEQPVAWLACNSAGPALLLAAAG
jgi:hypothetical protein